MGRLTSSDPTSRSSIYLQTLIRETVEPDSWVTRGGTPGEMMLVNGRLIVAQTRENHLHVGNFIQQLVESLAARQAARRGNDR